jgi:hypothetical protein
MEDESVRESGSPSNVPEAFKMELIQSDVAWRPHFRSE